jgi:putative phosphoesterase
VNRTVLDNVMKVGVLSDTHLHQLTNEFAHIYDEYLYDKDLILHAGDVVSPEIIDFLKAKDFYGVHGNMDPLEVKELLPEKRVINLEGYRLGIIHGWGRSDDLEDRILPLFHNVDVIVYGHSHIASNHTRDGVLFFNPGTATGYTSSGTHSIGVLELGDDVRGKIIVL